MFESPPALAQLVAPWGRLYSHSVVVSTLVVFVHVAALVVGGGLAIALDGAALRQRTVDPDARQRHLEQLAAAHRVVLPSLAVAIVTGVALLAADLDTFLGSWVFWVKMGLLLLLLANGALMTRAESRLRTGALGAWGMLRAAAFISIALWLTLTLAGVALTSAA